MNNLEAVKKNEVARPLKVLVPLIQEDLKNAERAGEPYYISAGEKMLEAKPQLKHGEFGPWIKRHFKIKERQAQYYMQLAKQTAGEKRSALRFSSMSDHIRNTISPTYNMPHTVRPTAWHEPVKEAVSRIDVDRLVQERQNKEKEAKLIRGLAYELIDIGYKVLATKLHPDKGGSAEAMARLNRARDLLKRAV